MTSGGPLVEVRGLEVAYGDRVVSRLPDLTVAAGECVALVGESGSGKTTALLAMLGLLDGTGARVSGRARVCGADLVTGSAEERRRVRGAHAALVMQSPQSSLNPTMRLGRLMKRTLARHGIRGDRARGATAAALADVGLPESVADRFPHQVSGGQAQRFGIALALALGAEVIAADEPTSALDVTVQAEVVGVLTRLRRERGLALLLVSHDLALVSTIADRVHVLRHGEQVESGPTERLLTSPKTDYLRELLAAVPRLRSEGSH